MNGDGRLGVAGCDRMVQRNHQPRHDICRHRDRPLPAAKVERQRRLVVAGELAEPRLDRWR
ncbi:hypothetical protein D3C85_1686810 [compost metagenome]